MMLQNRSQAGVLLAEAIIESKFPKDDRVIMALPRGGVPVAFEVAKKMKLPLDIISVKKIPCPGNPELALGAITETGELYYNKRILDTYEFSSKDLNEMKKKTFEKAKDLGDRLRGNVKPISISGKNVILVDDGIATGSTVEAAIILLRKKGAKKILLAAPVSSRTAYLKLKDQVDAVVILNKAENFWAVGQFYEDFKQVEDHEVIKILQRYQKVMGSNQKNSQLQHFF